MATTEIRPAQEVLNIVIKRGDDCVPFEIEYTVPAEFEPLDTGDWSAISQIRESDAVDAALVASWVITLSEDTGKLIIRHDMADTITGALTFTAALPCDCELTFPNGFKKTIWKGTAELEKDISRTP